MNDITPKKWASLYANEKFICIKTLSGLRRAGPDPKGEVIYLPVHAPSADIGKSLLIALAASRILEINEVRDFFDASEIVKRYEDWVSLLLYRYKYKTRRELFKSMKLCDIHWVKNMISISPTHHEKLEAWSGKGLDSTSDVVVEANVSIEYLGEAALLALSRCTGK